MMTEIPQPPIPYEALDFLKEQTAAMRDAFIKLYPKHTIIIATYISDQQKCTDQEVYTTSFDRSSCRDTDILRATGLWAQRLLNDYDESPKA